MSYVNQKIVNLGCGEKSYTNDVESNIDQDSIHCCLKLKLFEEDVCLQSNFKEHADQVLTKKLQLQNIEIYFELIKGLVN